jgi:hypothetical protein
MQDQGTISCEREHWGCPAATILLINADKISMSETIKNEAAERLARQVAGETGEPVGQIEDLLRRVDALPTLDARPEDGILVYGEDGIPR